LGKNGRLHKYYLTLKSDELKRFDRIGISESMAKYKELKTDLLGANSSLSDSLISVNLKDIEKKFEIIYNSKNIAEKVEDKIIISHFCSATITENPLKQPARSYPVDMVYRNAYVFKSEIKIPAGYKLLEKPADFKMDNPLAEISLHTELLNNETITITGKYEFKNDIYGTGDYVRVKDYFDKIVDKFNEKVVLVKI